MTLSIDPHKLFIAAAGPRSQRTPEWYAARRGRVTGSRIGALIGVSPWTTRDELIGQMVWELENNKSWSIPDNPAMQYGRTHEPDARRAYELESFEEVEEVGIFEHPDNPRFAASPDGFISPQGGVEFKCPYKYRNGAPDEWPTLEEQPNYYAQVQWCMLCTGREYWDFYQWAPTGKTHLERVHRDPDYIEMMVREADRALAEVDARLAGDTGDADAKYARYTALEAERKDLESRAKELKAEAEGLLQELGDELGEGAILGSHKLALVTRKGSVSYARAIKALIPDLKDEQLEPYRGADSAPVWALRKA